MLTYTSGNICYMRIELTGIVILEIRIHDAFCKLSNALIMYTYIVYASAWNFLRANRFETLPLQFFCLRTEIQYFIKILNVTNDFSIFIKLKKFVNKMFRFNQYHVVITILIARKITSM